MENLIRFISEFTNAYEREKVALPYHMNVIDELHINENGHSRILFQLLKYKNTKEEYEFLEYLLHYIRKKNKSFDINIRKPNISQEIERIDLWIRDTDYAIIFENKVYNADDQELQLSRYIDKTKDKHYDEDKIYIVYLSQLGSEPSEYSWGNYKNSFKERYVNLSFRDDILPWLKEYVLPNIRHKDYNMQCAVVQYIDYLEGLFNLRTNNKKMNMNLNRMIEDYYKLDKCHDDQERVSLLSSKIDEINNLIKQMELTQNVYRKKIYESWKQDTRKRYPYLIQEYKDYEWACILVFMEIENKDAIIFINRDKDNSLYCQFNFNDESSLDKSSLRSLKNILSEEKNNSFYKSFGANDFDDVYNCFLKVIEHCMKLVDK